MRPVRLLASAALLAAAVAPALAQQAPRPVFRSGTSLVEITVIFRDSRGAVVRDLTPRDLELVEDGAPRSIELMYLVEGPPPSAAQMAATPAVAGGSRQAPRTFVFAFDEAQMSARSLTLARDAAVKFARERLQPTDAAGVAVLGSSMPGRVGSAHGELIAQLGRLAPRGDLQMRERALREWPRILNFQEASEIARNLDSTLDRVRDRACQERSVVCGEDAAAAASSSPPGQVDKNNLKAMATEGNRQTIEAELRQKASAYVTETRRAAVTSIASLQSLAEALEAIRGRKTIIWFTEGTPILEAASQAREAAARASQAGVVVYAVDPRGLQSRAAGVLEAGPDAELDILKDTGDLSALMTSGTGGLFITNENRLDRALARVEDDTSSYYVIAYAANDAAPRARDRRVTVRVLREGLSARVRTGFVAPQKATTVTLGAAVASTLTSAPGTRWALAMPVAAAALPSDAPAERVTAAGTANIARLRGLSTGDDSTGLASAAWRAYERGDLEAALPLFEKASGLAGVRPWALYALGLTYVGLGRPGDAVAVWERVKAAAPDFTQVYLDLAAHYSQSSDISAALSVLRDAARRWPANEEIHNGIGVLLVRRNALDEAIAAFTAATGAAPNDPVSWLNLGRAYELRYDRGRRYDQQRLRWIGPEGEREKAARSYERCVELGGPYAELASKALARMNWSR